MRGFARRVTFLSLLICLLSTASANAADSGGAQRLTLELQDVNILDVFKIFSKKSGLNIVAGRNVQGKVSMFLQDVPIREALETILQSQGLASIEENGIIKVMTEPEYIKKLGRPYRDQRITKTYQLRFATADLMASKLNELKSPNGKMITEPRTNTLLITELPEILDEMEKLISQSDRAQETAVFHLRYAKAEDLEPKLKTLFEGGLGKVEIDKRSNRIIVMDIPTRIEQVEALIEALDVQVPQVLIEARIVEVRLDDKYRQGINWNYIARDLRQFDSFASQVPLTVSPPEGASSLSAFELGDSDDDLKIMLDLLETVGKTNILSSPRITALNNEEAKLAVATRQPFVSQTVVQTANSTNTADNVQFVDVGVTLRVEPRISHDDYVEMRIRPEISSSSEALELQGVAQGSNTSFTRTRIPVVTTQELDTTVLVKSGSTLVIGGLIQDVQRKQSAKVPLIGSIPFVGNAFQSKQHDFEKSELVIFLTPKIMHSIETPREEKRFFDPEKQLLPFEVVGNYPYRKTFWDPRRHIKTGEIPYWENPSGKQGLTPSLIPMENQPEVTHG